MQEEANDVHEEGKEGAGDGAGVRGWRVGMVLKFWLRVIFVPYKIMEV